MIRRLTIGFCLVALALGAFQAWTARFEMNPDGIQYLDNADAYWNRDFRHALSTQWSPLYPWLIGASKALARPTAEQEFPLVHALNFALFALSLVGFLFFLRSLRGAPSVGLLLLSSSAFLYCTLDFTNLRHVVPDLLVNFFAFVAAGLLARMASGTARKGCYAALGAVLGFGYLAKAPFLPIGLLCLCMAGIIGRRRVLLTAAVFLAIAAPYVATLSVARGRFTFGDSAKLNLAWQVNGLPNTNWQGGPDDSGRPIHPTRRLSANPAIFEFAAPIVATYPPWYDPGYWNEGVRIAYRPRDLARAIGQQGHLYGYLLFHRQVPLLFALIALFFLRSSQFRPAWTVLALGAMPFLLYAPVHAEGRYLAPFFVLLWTALFDSILEDGRVARAIAATAALLMVAGCFAGSFSPPTDQPPARLQFDVARQLKALGLKPRDCVAIVGANLPYYWARLDGARITLQISFDGDVSTRQAEWAVARSVLASQTAVFTVAPALDGVTDQPGWRELGTTRVFAYPAGP